MSAEQLADLLEYLQALQYEQPTGSSERTGRLSIESRAAATKSYRRVWPG